MVISEHVVLPISQAHRRFSEVTRSVDENGAAVLTKLNKPEYVVLGFAEYEELVALRRARISAAVNIVIAENLHALQELAK